MTYSLDILLHLFTSWWTSCLLPNVDKYVRSCYGHLSASFHVDISFQLLYRKIPKSVIAELYDKHTFNLIRNCPVVFQSAVPSISNEWQFLFFHISSPTFGVISVLNFGNSKRYIVVSQCFNSHVLNDLSGASFHTFIFHFSVVRCLLRCLANFFISLFYSFNFELLRILKLLFSKRINCV